MAGEKISLQQASDEFLQILIKYGIVLNEPKICVRTCMMCDKRFNTHLKRRIVCSPRCLSRLKEASRQRVEIALMEEIKFLQEQLEALRNDKI